MANKKDDWKEVSLESSDIWDRKEPIQGKLKAVKTDVGPNASKMYIITTDKGDISVWGSTVLDNKFEYVPNGVEVRIEPQGEVTSEKSGRKYQDFKVFFKEPQFEEVHLDNEEPSGYDKARAKADKLKGTDEPINLDEIPFG